MADPTAPPHEEIEALRHRVGELEDELARFRSMALDLDGWLRTKDELAESLALLQAALEATGEGLFVVSADREILAYNRRFVEMWQLPEDFAERVSAERPFWHDRVADPEAFGRRVRELYADPETEGQDVIQLTDGRVFERHSRPQRLHGRVVGRVWSYRDVTRRVRDEQELARRAAQLEEADRLKDQFLGILSHELRTPVHAIMGFGSVLADGICGDLTPEQERCVAKMIEGADGLLALINDLLDLTRIRAGKFTIRKGPVDLLAVVRRAVEAAGPQALARRVTLTLDAGSPVPDLTGDAVRLGQVVSNLVGNAIKFTPAGGRVEVRVRPEPGTVRVEVADTGIGLTPEVADRVFEPFYQEDMSDTRAAGGTGLGLSIARSLVEAHGGTIGVAATPGGGATFWFALPAG